MDDTVQILPIAEEHIESFRLRLDAVARERLYLASIEAPPPDATRTFVLSNLASNIPQFLAIVGNEVVGWCDISPLKHEGFRHCGELGMGIHKHYRGMGIGRQLITRTLQKAKEIGLERVELEVFASNTPAIRLYERMGFKVEGIKKKARKIDGKYDDLIMMALFI